jgi:hypothetical protein
MLLLHGQARVPLASPDTSCDGQFGLGEALSSTTGALASKVRATAKPPPKHWGSFRPTYCASPPEPIRGNYKNSTSKATAAARTPRGGYAIARRA